MPKNDFSAATCTYKTETRTFELDQLLLYVVEVNGEMAKESGLDLPSVGAIGIDSAGAVRVARTVGLTGRAYLKTVNGKTYLILKGNPGARPVLNGTRYLASNPLVAKLVVSSRTLGKAAVRATSLSVVAYAGLRIAEHILSENDPTLTRLLGTIGTDVLKFAVSAGLGYIAAVAVGSVTTVIVGPLIAAIVVGAGITIALDTLDKKFSLTETMVRAIEDTVDKYENPVRILSRWINDWEQRFIRGAIEQTINQATFRR